jgi:hypothetical protein
VTTSASPLAAAPTAEASARWMTLVLRNGPDEWTVTGTTGPVAIA